MTCEVCSKRPADREVTVTKDTDRGFTLRTCAVCALWMVAPAGIDLISP